MRFEVYCDESRPDLLSSAKPQAQHMVIGSLWMKAEDRPLFKRDLHQLRDRHKVGGEFKWQKVSPSRLDFYKELVSTFIAYGDRMRFRCIAVDHSQIDLKLYHQDDQELGFYKFYYHMLHHWVLDCNEYDFFVDFKRNRQRDRLEVLRRCLDCTNLSSRVVKVQAVRSDESVLIQLADTLTGMAAYRLNAQVNGGSAKFKLLDHFESLRGERIKPTYRSEDKFNVFKIDLRGGW